MNSYYRLLNKFGGARKAHQSTMKIFQKTPNSLTKQSTDPVQEFHKGIVSGRSFYRKNSQVAAYDPWVIYREYFRDNNQRSDVVLFPSGDASIDIYIIGGLEELSLSVSVFPVWEFLEYGVSSEDIHWSSAKEFGISVALGRQFANFTIQSGARYAVIPSQNNHLTSELKAACVRINVEVMPLNYPDFYTNPSSAEGGYERLICGSRKVSDALKVHDVSRGIYGIGENDNIVLIVCPMNLTSLPENSFSEVLASEIENLTSNNDIRDHVVLWTVKRKNGYLNNQAFSALSKIRRKTFLAYGDVVPVDLVKSASRVIAARGWERALVDLIRSEVAGISDGTEVQTARLFLGEGLEDAMQSRSLKVRSHLEADLDFINKLGRQVKATSVVAVPDPVDEGPVTTGRQKFVCDLIGANERVYAPANPNGAMSSDFHIQWGGNPSESKQRGEPYRTFYSRRKIFVEDGFVRSIGLWTDPNESTLSIILDTKSIYYDATTPSLLEDYLNSEHELSDVEIARAKNVMKKIYDLKISKYNYAPTIDLSQSCDEGRAILLVDQKSDDMSLPFGLCDASSFVSMLREALASDASRILVKQHPCAIDGGERYAHFTRKSIKEITSDARIELIAFDVNPYSLIEVCSSVFVGTSGMGVEALLAGKDVRCFGAPFYAGWGFTEDMISIPRRRRTRSFVEVFHAFYIRFSRYIDPVSGRLCEIEDLVNRVAMIKEQGKDS